MIGKWFQVFVIDIVYVFVIELGFLGKVQQTFVRLAVISTQAGAYKQKETKKFKFCKHTLILIKTSHQKVLT